MIGQRIRDRRNELNMSLRDLGEKTELTASFLSQVENDLTSPSISSLQRIANALHIPMFAFLDSDSQTEQVVRRDARKTLSFPEPHLTYELLTNDLHRQMAAYMICLKAGERHKPQPLIHPTEEVMYVLQGELTLVVGDRTYSLQPGDSIYYEGAQLRSFSAGEKEDLRVLCVITPPVL
jgi:transcriptional regulator with XRE-family HTH domain